MTLRSSKERLFQAICFEIGGLVLSVPAYALYSGVGAGEGALVMAALAVAVLIWSPLHNTVFDWLDLRLSGRVASDRPFFWRVVHAISHEMTTLVLTLPILVFLGGHGLWEALMLDLVLSVLYAAYAYVFHLVYDRLRPVRPVGVGLPAFGSTCHDQS